MRKKLIIATAAGALTLGGLAAAAPALADRDDPVGSAVERITEALSGLVSDGSLTQAQADEVASTLSEAGLGNGHFGHGYWGHGALGLGLEVAADTLGMTEDELRTALEPDGTSLADVAEQQGVSVDTLVDALVAAAQERIAEAVEDGDLTQERADELLADLEERVSDRVSSDAGPWRGGFGHWHGHWSDRWSSGD